MKMLYHTLICFVLLASSCSGGYDDSSLSARVSELERKLAALEQTLNSNTAAIQRLADAAANGRSITGVKTLEDGSGYVISFTSGDPVTIKNGKSPSVGIRKDTDGVYCWTLDGEWLLAGGKKVKAVGQDAVTPTFKIERDTWHVSYDNGASWKSLGSAVPEGAILIKGITLADGIARIELGNGTTLKLPLAAEGLVSGIGSMTFVPDFSDGVVRVYRSGGKASATLRYEILPAGYAAKLAGDPALIFSMKAVGTRTKAAGAWKDLPVTRVAAAGDLLTVEVSCDGLPAAFFSGTEGASVSLHVSDGVTTRSDGRYVPMVFGGERVKPAAFDPAKVVLSLAAVSDVHINTTADPSTKFVNALQQLKAKALEQDPDGLDGVLVAGDLIDQPARNQIGEFKTRYESVCDPAQIPLVYTIGNHDVPNYRWSGSVVSDAAYLRTAFGEGYFAVDKDKAAGTQYECRHCEIGGYHVLTLTPNGTQPVVYDPAAVTWLDNTLQQLTAAEPEKYVLVLTHPMIRNTVYGSMLGEDGGWTSTLPGYWATAALTRVLRKYPQAVVFGGHLHFPLNDPRSIWQGDFTVSGCGSVRYMAIEPGGYEDMNSATTMNDRNEFSQGNLVQFDAYGNLRLFRMDFYNKAVIGEPLTLSFPAADKSHLTKYSHTARSLANAAPKLSTLAVTVSGGNVKATFAAGTDDEFVHDYTLTLKQDGKVLTTKKILSDFYRHPAAAGMKKEYSVSLGTAGGAGDLEVTLIATDSWGATATLVKTVRAAGAVTLWVSDDAGSRGVAGGTGTVSSAWLTYSGGTLSWTANTTGRPRTAQFMLPAGNACTVTQLSPADFKGAYSFTSKSFCPDKGFIPVPGNKTTIDVTFGAPLLGETLADGHGKTYSNQLGIKGLFGDNFTADACIDIDYEAMTVRLGVFLDARKAQKCPSFTGEYAYAALLPECCTVSKPGAFEKPWLFVAPDLGMPDYEWLWFESADAGRTFSYTAAKVAQLISTAGYPYSPKYICGMSVVRFKGADATAANAASTYDTIYQFNTDSGNIGLVFSRK